MPQTVIACRMLEDELLQAKELSRCSAEIIWLEKQLHTAPHKLQAALQQAISAVPAGHNILLAFCRCGNALLGLESPCCRMVVPRFEDCLQMLRSLSPGSRPSPDIRTLYATRGWLHGERSFLDEYCACLARYGEETTRRVYDVMLGSYRQLTLVDTGAFPLGPEMERAQDTARALGLAYNEEKGGNRVLEKMLSGKWNDDFILLNPGETLTAEHFLP